MRSSIACIRCRRSKVKCVNNGVGTTCRSCENSGRECAYPSPVTGGGGGRRRDSLPGRPDVYAGGEGERRQRPRKIQHTFPANASSGLRDSPRPLLDALDPRLLSARVWQELFDIFQIHYSADLPFLHPPSFLKPLRQASLQSQPNGTVSEEPIVRPPASTEFLLAFLALTARFHPKLVAHHSPPTSSRPSNPLIASEYYAAAANERMASIWTDHRAHDIERTQAMLMLGLHEWGMCRGAKAWLVVGTAIRAAQAMGLQYELDLDDEPMSRSVALDEVSKIPIRSLRRPSDTGKPAEDVFTHQEIRRRTFWSCYIMDRYLSSGKYRPQMLNASELRIQLPASERSFLFGEEVRTLMLADGDKTLTGSGRADIRSQRRQSVLLGAVGTPEPSIASSPRDTSLRDSEQDKVKLEVGSDEGLVSRYIKILEIYGKVIKWSCLGGRRVELHPPWDERSEFCKLLQRCQDFKTSLPRQHTLTPQNTQAHISQKTSTPYTLLHTVYLLCQIILHREYVPFVPIRCSKPEGPLDEPTFSPGKYNIPPGYWEKSARECFRSAREIMDLVRTCQEWGALVETPIVGFAVYTVAFNGVYCSSFPWMDPDGHMCTRWDPAVRSRLEKPSESKGLEAAQKALEMIGQMRNKLHMADGWFKTINKMHKYYSKIKKDYQKSIQFVESGPDGDSPLSTRHLSLREGGPGGGLDDFKILERTLQDFGNLEDQDVEMTDANQSSERPLDTVYDESNSGEATVKSEDAGEKSHPIISAADLQRQEGGAWSAINTGSGASINRQSSISTASSAQFRSYDSYPSQTSQPPPPQSHPHQLPTPHAHIQSLNSFRPTCSDASSSISASAGPPPSLTSSAAHSITASTPSQPSPPYDRQQGYGNWNPQGSSSYALPAPPPPSNPYTNADGAPHSYHHHHGLPSSTHLTSANSPYPSPNQPSHPTQQTQPQPPLQGIQQPGWSLPAKNDEWINRLDTRLGGEDVVNFVEGSDVAQWAHLANNNQDYASSWLGMIWQNNKNI